MGRPSGGTTGLNHVGMIKLNHDAQIEDTTTSATTEDLTPSFDDYFGVRNEQRSQTPPHNWSLETKDVTYYFSSMVEKDGHGDPHQTPDDFSSDITRRFANKHSLDQRISDLEKEKAINKALEHLALSVITSDPPHTSEWLPQLEAQDLPGSLSSSAIGSIADSLDALCAIAPSLISHRTRRTMTALAPHQLNRIAHIRASFWTTEIVLIDGEYEWRKKKVSWASVRKLWYELWEEHDIWVDEVVFRILCAVPLVGGGSITQVVRFFRG